VAFVLPVRFVHAPLTFFWSWMVAPAMGVPPVALSVPLIVKFWLTDAVDGAVAEHVHVGDVGPKREHPFALNAIHQTVYSKSTYVLEIEEASLIQ
jgi:hypothetical protein